MENRITCSRDTGLYAAVGKTGTLTFVRKDKNCVTYGRKMSMRFAIIQKTKNFREEHGYDTGV